MSSTLWPLKIRNRTNPKLSLIAVLNLCKRFSQDLSMEIANRFCHYFSNIGPNLANRIQSTTSYKNFLPGHFPQSMFLNLATQEEIIDIASTFPAGKSAGYDNIPMSIIKRSICSVSSPLTHIVNLSITHGIVPG